MAANNIAMSNFDSEVNCQQSEFPVSKDRNANLAQSHISFLSLVSDWVEQCRNISTRFLIDWSTKNLKSATFGQSSSHHTSNLTVWVFEHQITLTWDTSTAAHKWMMGRWQEVDLYGTYSACSLIIRCGDKIHISSIMCTFQSMSCTRQSHLIEVVPQWEIFYFMLLLQTLWVRINEEMVCRSLNLGFYINSSLVQPYVRLDHAQIWYTIHYIYRYLSNYVSQFWRTSLTFVS